MTDALLLGSGAEMGETMALPGDAAEGRRDLGLLLAGDGEWQEAPRGTRDWRQERADPGA